MSVQWKLNWQHSKNSNLTQRLYSQLFRYNQPAMVRRASKQYLNAWHKLLYAQPEMYTVTTARSLISNLCSVTKGHWYAIENNEKSLVSFSLPLEFRGYWSFQMTSNVICLETYKNIKTMHWSETWINLIYMNF